MYSTFTNAFPLPSLLVIVKVATWAPLEQLPNDVEIETSGLELKFVILISTGFNSNIFRLLNLSLLLLISTISKYSRSRPQNIQSNIHEVIKYNYEEIDLTSYEFIFVLYLSM